MDGGTFLRFSHFLSQVKISTFLMIQQVFRSILSHLSEFLYIDFGIVFRGLILGFVDFQF